MKAPWLPTPLSPELARLGTSLFRRIAKTIGAPSVDPVSADMAQHFWYADASRAEHELGWTSRDPLETLADTVNDLRARGVVWPAANDSSAFGAEARL